MARAARYSSRLDLALFVVCLLFAFVMLVLPAPMREPVAESLRRTVVAPLVGLQRGAEGWRAAWVQSRRAQARSDSLALRTFNVTAVEQENAQLRSVLGLGARLRWGFIPAEALHSTAREDIVTTITLTAGSSAGVRRYSPVVAPEGIVGLVQTVDPALSIAILFSHPDFRTSAMSADGSAYGIVYPHLGSGAQRYLLELRGVPFRANLKPGATILTSGLGGTFPRGIPIGTILREMRTTEVWTRTYLVQPAVNPANVSAVMVLNPQRVTEGVGSVWASIAEVDSAARKIAAAGDSLARQSALAEAAARRAALDSVARANGLPTDTAAADTTGRPPAIPGAQPTPRPATPSAGAPVRPTTSPTVRDTTRRPAAPAPTRRDTARRPAANPFTPPAPARRDTGAVSRPLAGTTTTTVPRPPAR